MGAGLATQQVFMAACKNDRAGAGTFTRGRVLQSSTVSTSEPSRNLDNAERGQRPHTEAKSPITCFHLRKQSFERKPSSGWRIGRYVLVMGGHGSEKGDHMDVDLFRPPRVCPSVSNLSSLGIGDHEKDFQGELLAQAINQTAPRTALPQVDRAEWWKGARPEDMESSKWKRTGNKGALPSKRSATATIQDKVAFLNPEKPYIQRARDLRRAKK